MVKILNAHQIGQKIRRLAIEITEQNWEEPLLVLAGINKAGYYFAKLIQQELQAYAPTLETRLVNLKLNPANPITTDTFCDCPPETFHNNPVIIIDDVANTGRTMFFAFKPLLEVIPSKIQVAVLIDRTHKKYPVLVDYVGLRLATTLHEHIDVHLSDDEEHAVFMR